MKYCSIAEKYINDVLNGNVNVSKLTKLTYIRQINDLEMASEKGWYFDKEAAERIMKFFSLLNHTKGRRFVNKPFILEPWQCSIVYIIFGWKKADGTRRFSKTYTEIPKKNGKTAFAAGIADFLLGFDDEAGAEVYCAATKKEQAKICFSQAYDFISKNTKLKAHLGAKFVTNNVNIPLTGSKMEPLGRDSLGLDGINPSAAIIDEFHEWKNTDVLDSIESATVSREQSLVFIITTAGLNKTFPCFEFRDFCIDILKGIKVQDDIFTVIHTLDEKDDWRDPLNWAKANPNYNISVIPDKLRAECEKAINQGGAKEVSFKTKNLNLWVDAPTVWIQDEKILACNYDTDPEKLTGKECYGGLDLASHVDINAFALFFPKINGRAAVKMWYFIPESKVTEREDRVDYRRWIAEGRIIMTPGNIIDIDEQVNHIYKIIKQYDCRNIAFDPAKAYHGTVQALQKKGLDKILDEFNQGIRYMSEPIREMQRMVEGAEIDLLADPVLRWMFRNAVAYTDTNDNIKLDKKKSQDKIDGLIALANAIGGYMSGDKIKPYEKHSLREINF
ncbi:MAG: terminase large subunit [Desulfobulbaceae bacterium]|nr:terminase large subunit [Desulfobulbaceae bacterium]